MNIEVKNSVKLVDYNESMKILERRVEEVLLGKKNELLWILEHNTVYTAGTSSNEKDLINKNIEIIKKYGWKSSPEKIEGTFTDYEDIDCGFQPIHQYFKFVKYGYGRATDHACYKIRQGQMTKKEAKELIIEYDGKLPTKYFKEFLEFVNITEEHFFKTRERFTNPILFKKINDNK